MKAATTIKYAYIDFDAFFAGVEEVINPAIRGQPIAVTPFEAERTSCIIAANYTAKAAGVKSPMALREAREICPTLNLVPQKPDRYVKAHHRLCAIIEKHAPISAICSIDEMYLKLDAAAIANPQAFARNIKADIHALCGGWLTCSIGFAASPLLAKIGSELDKPDGVVILHPKDLPDILSDLDIGDIPGIGKNMKLRLHQAGIFTMSELWQSHPKQLRAIWHSVEGERFWYELHGYDVERPPTKRAMYGHSRMLAPEQRHLHSAYDCAHLLTVKATKRMRRDGWVANSFSLYINRQNASPWHSSFSLHGGRNDVSASLHALNMLWQKATKDLTSKGRYKPLLKSLNVCLYDLTPATQRQQDLFEADDQPDRTKSESLNAAIDKINVGQKRQLVQYGMAKQPSGGFAGAKIAFTRIPDAEDFCD